MGKSRGLDRSRMYMCTGENHRNGVRIGDCGDIRSLTGWLEHFYPERTREELLDYFGQAYKNSDITEYLHRILGKRLEAVEKEEIRTAAMFRPGCVHAQK